MDVNIGSVIRIGRRKKNWKQKDLAKVLDVSPALVSSWETGNRIPPGDDLLKIANLLDIVDLLFPNYKIQRKDAQDDFISSFILREEPIEYKVANLAKTVNSLQKKIAKLEDK